MATETCIFLRGHISYRVWQYNFLVWSEQQLHLLPTSFISFRDLKLFTLKFFPIANHQLLHNFTRQLTFNAPNFSLDILLKLRDLGRHLNKRFLIENIYRNLLITYNNFFLYILVLHVMLWDPHMILLFLGIEQTALNLVGNINCTWK